MQITEEKTSVDFLNKCPNRCHFSNQFMRTQARVEAQKNNANFARTANFFIEYFRDGKKKFIETENHFACTLSTSARKMLQKKHQDFEQIRRMVLQTSGNTSVFQ